MRLTRTLLSAASVILLASAAYAADTVIAPVPAPLPIQSMDRITPGENPNASDIMTTHKQPNAPAPDAALPWKSPDPIAAAPMPAAPMSTPGKIPFGRGEAPAPIIPSGPHATIAVPVVDVQSLDAPEAAPPTQADPQADPVKQDPAEPTELTSPIFGESDNPNVSRKIILRLLNKVTAQATLLTFKPNETIKVGQLEITAITCQTSAPQSQTDYAGLIDIVERAQTNKTVKPLFRGWMYASSPSIAALEHPVYDVVMVECQTAAPAPKKEEKVEEKTVKKGKK